jgi:hypothetical protein
MLLTGGGVTGGVGIIRQQLSEFADASASVSHRQCSDDNAAPDLAT